MSAGDGASLRQARREAFQFGCLFRVRYSEIDGQQIVFNAHYLTWFDTALAEYLRELDVVYGSAREGALAVDFHTVRNVIDYHAPVRFDEVIAVCARIARIGSSSITFEMAVFARGDAAPRCSGQVVWVCAGIGDHVSQPIPDDLRARFEAARHAEPVEVNPVLI